MPKRRVLGIDPGIGRCGWAIVTIDGGQEILNASGCITTSPKETAAARLLALSEALKKIIAVWQPEALGIEKLFFTKNVTTAMAVSQARGVVILAAAYYQIPVTELSPTTVKQSITGYGRASKKEIAKMINLLLRPTKQHRTDDEYDAIGIALSLAHRKL